MTGDILLNVNEYENKIDKGLHNYTMIRDITDSMEEIISYELNGWEGIASEKYKLNFVHEIDYFRENINKVLDLLKCINNLVMELKKTQEEVKSLVDEARVISV